MEERDLALPDADPPPKTGGDALLLRAEPSVEKLQLHRPVKQRDSAASSNTGKGETKGNLIADANWLNAADRKARKNQ